MMSSVDKKQEFLVLGFVEKIHELSSVDERHVT